MNHVCDSESHQHKNVSNSLINCGSCDNQNKTRLKSYKTEGDKKKEFHYLIQIERLIFDLTDHHW